MKCPFCGYLESKVCDSRPTDEGMTIRRRRECLSCGKRFTTYEKLEHTPFYVIKKDNTREPFDRNKVLNGLLRACEKRPVPIQRLEEVADHIEAVTSNTLEGEVTTARIGELVMESLKELDDVAYVRFASVYRQFKDLQTFLEELESMMKTGKGEEK